jgi:23S rRNA pseudouridine2457 synthase
MDLKYYKLYKPYRVLSQFTKDTPQQICLKDITNLDKDIYPVGRLDYDSEGLLLLTNDTTVNHQLLNPKMKTHKVYYAQLEGAITDEAIQKLKEGVEISIPAKKRKTPKNKDKNHKQPLVEKYTTLPCEIYKVPAPQIPERNPSIRVRENIPTTWISLFLIEGKNHQVRKMCAAVGFPVLRLIRYSIGKLTIKGMDVGDLVEITREDIIPNIQNKIAAN